MIEIERKTAGRGRDGTAKRKERGFMLIYPVIDVQETGKRLKRSCEHRQVSARELQEFLGLSALQSIYSWFQGRTLPSLDNFYALSRYLGVHMEELVVPRRRQSGEIPVWNANGRMERRQMAYYAFWLRAEAAV